MKNALSLVIVLTMLIGGSVSNVAIDVPYLTELDHCGIPVDYYDQRCIIPWAMPVETWLTVMKWPRPYERDAWDCSQMAAFTEWALENCGYEAETVLTRVIIQVPRRRMIRGRMQGHAYVRVLLDGVWRNYEATSRRWLTARDMALMRGPDLTFGSIYSLYYFTWDKVGFAREWAWWGHSPPPICETCQP